MSDRVEVCEECGCGPADVAYETGATPDHAGRITVTGYCAHGNAVALTHDSIL